MTSRACRVRCLVPGPGAWRDSDLGDTVIMAYADPERILAARLTGIARRHARWRELTEAEEAAAVAELRAVAGGRADLLAEVAGIMTGAAGGALDEPCSLQAAGLCRKAGADPDAIPAWVDEGRRRAANAHQMPFSGGLARGGPGPRVPRLPTVPE